MNKIEQLEAENAALKNPDFRQMREMLRAMQAGELTVSRGIEILEMWHAGNWNDNMLPPVRQDLIEEDSMPVEIIDRLKLQLAASQAREQQLREKLIKAAVHVRPTCDDLYYEIKAVLMPPPDTTALEAMINKAGEIMRGRCLEAGVMRNYKGAIVSRLSADGRDKSIRALPAVTIEDAKGGAA